MPFTQCICIYLCFSYTVTNRLLLWTRIRAVCIDRWKCHPSTRLKNVAFRSSAMLFSLIFCTLSFCLLFDKPNEMANDWCFSGAFTDFNWIFDMIHLIQTTTAYFCLTTLSYSNEIKFNLLQRIFPFKVIGNVSVRNVCTAEQCIERHIDKVWIASSSMPFYFAKRSSYVREHWESDEKNAISWCCVSIPNVDLESPDKVLPIKTWIGSIAVLMLLLCVSVILIFSLTLAAD